MIQHMVLLKFKPAVAAAQIDELFGKFEATVTTMDGLESFSGGANTSPEGINPGYNYGFSMVFRDAAARDAYLPSPEHVEIAGGIGDMLDGDFDSAVVAFDYEF